MMRTVNEILQFAESYENSCQQNLEKLARIKKLPNGKYRVLSEKGKNLGTTPTKEKAKQRLQQVEYFKHKDQNESDDGIDLTKIDDFSFSAVMRQMRQQGSKEQVREFLKIFKSNFDKAIKNKSSKPERIALEKTFIQFSKIHSIKIDKKLIKTAGIKKAEINRLQTVVPEKLFRGSAPTPQDVLFLKENLGIKKIVSLDKASGEKISKACKMLGIDQIKLYLDGSRKSLLNFLSHNIKDLLIKDGPTFVHCAQGKDRTGLAVALYKCKYMNEDPEKAIKEAKDLGFGIGVSPEIIQQFEKIIRNCKPSKDNNDADIVSNERQYIGDNKDSYLDEGHQSSFAPYLDFSKQFPQDFVYNEINDQSPTRQNYKSINTHNSEKDEIPLIGIYNNNAGIHGAGPAEPVGGFINE